jgi:ubiquinone biosynthesis protein
MLAALGGFGAFWVDRDEDDSYRPRVRHLRIYRLLCTGLVIVGAAWRYYWLLRRERRAKRPPTQADWDRAHTKTGNALYFLATHLGGVMVKLGQVIGARTDVFPAALVAPLRGLHDRVPARPFAKLAGHVERELGQPIDEVFKEVEPTAIAAASLAQVHRARLVTGEEVALKVQYPEARRLFPTDLRSLRWAVRVTRWLQPSLDLRVVANELAAFVELELDFEREASSTDRVRANLASDPTIVVPHVYRATRRILILEFLHGTPLSNPAALRARSVDLRATLRRIATLYATMIFEHGFFHGDPHPGNILVLDDGRLGLLDFGLAKDLPEGFPIHAADLLRSVLANNAPDAALAARKLGFVIADDLVPTLLVLVRALLGDYQNVMQHLNQLAPGRFEIPSHFTLIMRAMVILNGVSHSLVPNERIAATALAGSLLSRLRPTFVAPPPTRATPVPVEAQPSSS